MFMVVTCSLDLTTSMGMATSQLQMPAMPDRDSHDHDHVTVEDLKMMIKELVVTFGVYIQGNIAMVDNGFKW